MRVSFLPVRVPNLMRVSFLPVRVLPNIMRVLANLMRVYFLQVRVRLLILYEGLSEGTC